MSTDARISTGFPNHPKTKKLIHRLGQQAAWNLVCLFLSTAVNKSDGDLAGMSVEDIELAAEWKGAEGKFVETLVELRFLDGQMGTYSVHDWEEHNPWAAGTKQRSAKAKWNAAKRHHGEAFANSAVPEYACVRHAPSSDASIAASSASSASSPSSNASSTTPSPSPSPSPSPKKKTISSAKPTSTRFLEFWAIWPNSQRKVAKAECAKRWAARGLDAQADGIVAHVQALKATRNWREGFEPAPLTYLNQRRWEDADGSTDASSWWLSAGFADRYEAENAGCRDHNAAQFEDGKRIAEVAR
jgi:hypothetical protein